MREMVMIGRGSREYFVVAKTAELPSSEAWTCDIRCAKRF